MAAAIPLERTSAHLESQCSPLGRGAREGGLCHGLSRDKKATRVKPGPGPLVLGAQGTTLGGGHTEESGADPASTSADRRAPDEPRGGASHQRGCGEPGVAPALSRTWVSCGHAGMWPGAPGRARAGGRDQDFPLLFSESVRSGAAAPAHRWATGSSWPSWAAGSGGWGRVGSGLLGLRSLPGPGSQRWLLSKAHVFERHLSKPEPSLCSPGRGHVSSSLGTGQTAQE